jgi:signal transduction histidine kinase
MQVHGHMLPIRNAGFDRTDALAAAFATFTASADELQRSYAQWGAEVAVLRQHLQQKEQELAREREQSRHLRALAEVAAVLAHEVRNPVASMELFAGLLAQSDQLQGGDERGWVMQLQAGFRQLNATVSNVLHFHSSSRAELLPLQISPVLQRAVEFITPLAQRSNVDVTLVNHLDDASVCGNEERLIQVLLNLALNSVRVMSGEGALAIRGMASSNAVEISVRDSGPGIPDDIRDKIFEPGFSTRPGSAGLGLAVCKRIIAEHEGEIEIVPGQPGAMFVIRLPKTKDARYA